jgi:hypothetical protein
MEFGQRSKPRTRRDHSIDGGKRTNFFVSDS